MGMDRAIKKKRWTVKRIIWLTIIVSTATALAWATATVSSKSTYRMKADYATISTVKNGKFIQFTPLRALVEPSRSMPINIQQGGTVAEIYAEEGDIVKAGDPLVRFDNPDFEQSLDEKALNISEQLNRSSDTRLGLEQSLRSLKDQLIDAEYRIKKQKRDLELNESLYKQQLASKDTVDQMREDLELQQKKYERLVEDLEYEQSRFPKKIEQINKSDARANRQLDNIEKSIDKLITRAPISGQVIDMQIELGENKNAGPLGRIDNIETFILSAEVSEHYISDVKEGQVATFSVGGESHTAEISKVFPTIQNGNFKIRLKFVDEQPENLRRGRTINGRLELSAPSDSLLVDNGSFVQDTGGNWAFVLNESGTVATRRDISLGKRNKDVAVVNSGLKAGDKVIISSYSGMEDIDEIILTK